MIWWPRQMPNTGSLPSSPCTLSRAPSTAAGSPGPFERNTPSGSRASTSAAGVDAGTTSTWQPACDELVEDRALDPEVVRDDEEASRRRARPCTAPVVVTSRDEVAPVGAAVGLRGREQRVAVGDAERARASRPPRGCGASGGGCRCPAMPATRWRSRKPVEVVGRAPVRRPAREIAHDHAAAVRRRAPRRRRR